MAIDTLALAVVKDAVTVTTVEVIAVDVEAETIVEEITTTIAMLTVAVTVTTAMTAAMIGTISMPSKLLNGIKFEVMPVFQIHDSI